MDKRLVGVDYVESVMGVSRSQAYKIIRELNDELVGQGKKVVQGRVSKSYLEEAYFGQREARDGLVR